MIASPAEVVLERTLAYTPKGPRASCDNGSPGMPPQAAGAAAYDTMSESELPSPDPERKVL